MHDILYITFRILLKIILFNMEPPTNTKGDRET